MRRDAPHAQLRGESQRFCLVGQRLRHMAGGCRAELDLPYLAAYVFARIAVPADYYASAV